MGKVSPISSKYIVNAKITIEGAVDKPDVIGAVFGQTEGLLGAELELRELQRSGKIGRIEVKLETHNGKVQGYIVIPSSLDQAETAIIAAALETIERIGPCNSHVTIESIDDVRITKRNFVVERAKELLEQFKTHVMPDSHEMTEEVSQSVRAREVLEWGADKLPCGPLMEESEDVILVEGRADVINLLKHGFKNAVALNGTSVPETVKDLCRQKSVTAFVDGDRGGDLILRELMAVAEIDYITKAPDGKELEELTKKEIHIALRNRIAASQYHPAEAPTRKMQQARITNALQQGNARRDERHREDRREERPHYREERQSPRREEGGESSLSDDKRQGVRLQPKERDTFKEHLFNLIGTRGAYLLDKDFKVLGKIPLSELDATIKDVHDVKSVVVDGAITKELLSTIERHRVHFLVAAESHVRPQDSRRVKIVTQKDLE